MATQIGRPVRWDLVKRVKELRGEGKTYRVIADILSAEEGRPLYLPSIHRWSKL
jgi:hypothetical protein